MMEQVHCLRAVDLFHCVGARQITGGQQVDEVLQLDKSIKAKDELIKNLLRCVQI